MADESSSDENDNDAGYYFEIDCESEQLMDPELADDLSQVIVCFGEDAVHYRILGSIGEMDISLRVNLNLQEDIANAWGLISTLPIVLKLHVPTSHYRRGNVPTLSVLQYVDDEMRMPQYSRAGNQLTKIMETFVAKYWNRSANAGDSSADEDLSSLLDMGFPMDDCRRVLRNAANRQQAVDMLLHEQKTKTAEMKNSHSFSLPKKSGTKELSKSQTIQNMSGRLTLIPSSTERGLTAKQLPSLKNGFLVQAMEYMSQRIPTLNEYCVVCDEAHVFQNGAMLKPAVCSRELCVFSFGTLGVMADTADCISSGAEVIDLLVNLFKKSAQCKRNQLVLDPFPTFVDPRKAGVLAFTAHKKDWSKLEKLVEKFPEMSTMAWRDGPTLKRFMDSRDVLLYPLLQWIISSNRSHIVRLPKDKQLSFMHTPHQFLLMCSPPAKEAKFRQAKRQFGSSFAMHGSSIENWHSILRNGLVVASGTRHQMHGAAYGNGIYLSPNSSVSMGYSDMGRGPQRMFQRIVVGSKEWNPPQKTPEQQKAMLDRQELSSAGRGRGVAPTGGAKVGALSTRLVRSFGNEAGAPNSPAKPTTGAIGATGASPSIRFASNTAGLGRGAPTSSKRLAEPEKKSEHKRFLSTPQLSCIALCEVVESKQSLTKHSGSIWVCNNPDHVCTRFLFVYEDGAVADIFDTTSQKIDSLLRDAIIYQT